MSLLTPQPNGLHTPPDSDPKLSFSNQLLTLTSDATPLALAVQEQSQDIENDSKHRISTPVPVPSPSPNFGAPSAINELPSLSTMHGFVIPETQDAVITPEVRNTLNIQKKIIPVRRPKLSEVVVRMSWTGMCRSVSLCSCIFLASHICITSCISLQVSLLSIMAKRST